MCDDDLDLDVDDIDVAARELDEQVSDGLAAFMALVDVPPGDRALAMCAAECVLRSLADARGPDDPTPGMLNVPGLIDDALARAHLADASPTAREALGDLERALLPIPQSARQEMADRLREAIRTADRRLGA